VHILGICGTFMGGIAAIARESGFVVSGSDASVYPPMSTQLEQLGIALREGYHADHLQPAPDQVIVGNALSRGNPAIEYLLDYNLSYTSGPQWLAEHVLQQRHVLAVAGTHGKTTTSSMLLWILECAGLQPGYLIGGVPQNFGSSARLGSGRHFVIEADEYDTAFFDKRSKFVHYRPRTLIVNNIEYDHADIFPDLAAIQRQFHHLLRTVPQSGLVIRPLTDPAVDATIKLGIWTPQTTLGSTGADWTYVEQAADQSAFEVRQVGTSVGRVHWDLIGKHNAMNALAAIAAAVHVGVEPGVACQALHTFKGVKRRLECLATVAGVTVYDDFAHHPTAVATTIAGLRKRVGRDRIVAVLEPRSNTMRLGSHKDALAQAFVEADEVVLYQPPQLGWDLDGALQGVAHRHTFAEIDSMVGYLSTTLKAPDHCLIMSNGGFGGIHQKLIKALGSAANS
jgi:UDP-N-acetylmuramate: L-alanyl-gamma-D-glutamyl-meso-diaminopimelate ligase